MFFPQSENKFRTQTAQLAKLQVLIIEFLGPYIRGENKRFWTE
jgi:hypothetical protein